MWGGSGEEEVSTGEEKFSTPRLGRKKVNCPESGEEEVTGEKE